jgi:excisionase family DNA binding protein
MAVVEVGEFPRVLTVEQVRQILQIGRKQAYELCQSQRLKSFKVGVSVRVSEEALHAFMNSSSVPGRTAAEGQGPDDDAG